MAEDDSDSDKKNDNAHKHQVLAVDWRLIAASLSGCGFFMNNTDTHSLDLNKDGESSSLFKQKWSGMRLVDTVVLDDAGEVESWIFTAKTGEITAKKKFQDRAKVVERFTRFALANSSNTEGYVALVSSSSIRRQAHPGERTVVDRIALEEAMIGSEAVPPGFVGRTLQCYLRPQHGANSFLRGRVRAGDKSFSLMSLSPLFQRAPTASGCLVESNTPAETDSRRVEERDLGADGLHDQIKSALTSLAAFLEPRLCEAGADPTAIWDCEADFIVDDNGELWLTSLPNVTVSPKAAARVVESDTLALGTQSSINSAFPDRIGQRESDEDGADTVHRTLKTKQHMPPLTTAVADAADAAPTDGAATPLGTARTGTSEPSTALAVQILATDGRGESSTANSKSLKVSQVVLPEIPTMLGARSNRGEHNRSGDADERATPIIQKSGGVYLANVHASALRGLCCWREYPTRRGTGTRTTVSPCWQLVEGRYKGNLSGEDSRGDNATAASIGSTSSAALFGELSDARYKMIARSVLLALAAESFLRGDEPLGVGETNGNTAGGSDDALRQGSLARRWKQCDQRAQLSLASANPQAYYEEVTVCGNCMEICRKLDSIRSAGFPEGTTAASAGFAAIATASGDSPARPSSEPLPEFVTDISGQERPGTAISATEAIAPGDGYDASNIQWDDAVGDGNSAGARELSSTPPTLSQNSPADREGKIEVEQFEAEMGMKELIPEQQAVRIGGGEAVGEHDGQAPTEDVPCVEKSTVEKGVDEKAYTGRRKQKAASSKALVRISGVYGGGSSARVGRDKPEGGSGGAWHRSKARSATSNSDQEGELPNATALARFAIERERLAREVGMEELGSPATLEVVNMGVRRQTSESNCGTGTKGRSHARKKGGGRKGGQGDGKYEQWTWGRDEEQQLVQDSRSASEILLEKLESVAEARSFQSGAILHGGDSVDQYNLVPTHGDWSSGSNIPRFGSDDPWNGIMGELSTTESAFLERFRRQGLEGNRSRSITGSKGDPLLASHFEQGFRGGTRGVGGGGGEYDTWGPGDDGAGGGSGGAATIGALRDRLAGAEAENKALISRSRRAEEELAAEAGRADKARKKLAQARTEFSRAMSEKDEDHRRKELVLEEKHSRDLARKSQSIAEEMAQQPSGEEGGTDAVEGRGLGGFRGDGRSSKNLLARLEQALKDMAEQQRRFADTKRSILAEKAHEVAVAETKGRRELQEARSLAAAMEDRASVLQEQVSEAAKNISTLKAREKEQIRRRQVAEEEAEKSRKDIGVLRQTVQQSQSMDITDESGGRRDGQSTLAAATATSEARIRTLNNKVEFLKAQLSSEQTLKAEVEAALALSRKNLFDAQDERRKQAAAADKAREVAVEEAVARIQRQMEESMSEAYRVQSKLQVLQDQLNDSLGDLSMARRREESLKAELAQAAAKLDGRTEELEKAQSRANDLAEARAADSESTADRAAREAVVRRLDNERQYLKSQLQSEITCRDELREALATATRQLGEIKTDWSEEQAARTEEFQQQLHEKTGAIGDLTAEKVAMEAELVAATRQLGLLKEGYSKARDNLRAEQSALETARTANRRLREQVQALSDELTSTRTQQGEDAKRHSQSLVAAQTALDEADESKRKQAVDQQLHLREQLLKTGEVQRQLMALQAHLNERESASKRMLAAERLGQGLVRWSRNRKGWAFLRIMNGVAITTAESDVRERTRRALREAGEQARRNQDAAVEEAHRAAEADALRQLDEVEQSFAVERVALLERADKAAADAAEQEKNMDDLRSVELVLTEQLEKIRTEVKVMKDRHREKMERAAEEAETRAQSRVQAAVTSTKAACTEEAKQAAEESDERWRAVLRENLDKAKEASAVEVETVTKEHDAVLEETQHAFRIQLERVREEGKALVAAATTSERERGKARETKAREAGAAEAAAAYDQTRHDDRCQADEELTSKLAEADERARAEMVAVRAAEEGARQRMLEDEKIARVALEKELAAARERAVKLEGGKWQRASQEAEARAEAEKVAAYERGMADRSRRAEAEAAQLQEAAEKALEEVKQGARTTIDEMAKRHSEALEAERKCVSEEEAAIRETALEEAKEESIQQQAKAVANARAAATAEARSRAEKARISAVEAAREREKLVTEKVQDELRSAKIEWVAEKRQLKEKQKCLEEAEEKAKEELLRAMVNSSQATQRARARWEEGQKVAMEKAAAQAVEDRDKALEDARRAFSREKKRALMETQDAFGAQAEAMAERLREQAKDSLQQVEAAHTQTKQEKEKLKEALEHMRTMLKEKEAVAFHAERDAKEQALSHSLRTWRLAATAIERGRAHFRMFEQAREEASQREAAAEVTADEQRQKLSADIEELLHASFDARRRFSDMQETLVNHKREVLIDHKVQSASLHKELDSLARGRDQLEEQRLILHREFRELEGQAKNAEKEAHSHSRKSAIGPDGMVIPAVARKKRRLDEELEALLDAMEAKRKALVGVDSKLTALAEDRSAKDDEMKGLERTLVQVLVEQQKKLLALLSEAGEKDEKIEEISNRTRAARDEVRRRKAKAQAMAQEIGASASSHCPG